MPDRSSGSSRGPDAPPAARPSGPVGAAIRAETRRRRRVFLLSGLLVALSGAALVNYGVFGPAPNPEVPEELRGTWVADEPRYAGRSLALDANVVTLGTGDGREPALHAVYDVRQQAVGGLRRYLITYLVGRDDVTMTVLYRPGASPVLELENPPGVVWRRVR